MIGEVLSVGSAIVLRDTLMAASGGKASSSRAIQEINAHIDGTAISVSKAGVAKRIEDERAAARQSTGQWYAERIQWLEEWFRTPAGKSLPEEIQLQFWSIVANGVPDHKTNPVFQQQLNLEIYRRRCAEKERDEVVDLAKKNFPHLIANLDQAAIQIRQQSMMDTVSAITAAMRSTEAELELSRIENAKLKQSGIVWLPLDTAPLRERVLVKCRTDDGLCVEIMERYERYWVFEGQATFEFTCYIEPIAWAKIPPLTDEVPGHE